VQLSVISLSSIGCAFHSRLNSKLMRPVSDFPRIGSEYANVSGTAGEGIRPSAG
jgi:hypothetical protein